MKPKISFMLRCLISSLVLSATGFVNTMDVSALPKPARVVSSDTDGVGQAFKDKKFDTLSPDKLRSRMPMLVSPPTGTSVAPANVQGESSGSAQGSGDQNVVPAAFGSAAGVPFSTSRVLGGTTNEAQADTYRRAGKLYMAFGGTTYNYICSASLIGKSLVVTAAHCVHNFGQQANGWATKVKFVPAFKGTTNSRPYGEFESSSYVISSTYYNGTDTCDSSAPGVVCNNDIALISLPNNSSGQQAGVAAGYFGYGWNDYSYAIPVSNFQSVFGNKKFAAITQLGYPGSFDSGNIMQINTAYGASYINGNLKNTQLGSAMTGGSSGGPWLVNFGINATGGSYGSAANRNTVVGVTSWGYTDPNIKVMGASRFGQNVEFNGSAYGSRGAGNIGSLVNFACDDPAGWQLQSLGRCN